MPLDFAFLTLPLLLLGFSDPLDLRFFCFCTSFIILLKYKIGQEREMVGEHYKKYKHSTWVHQVIGLTLPSRRVHEAHGSND